MSEHPPHPNYPPNYPQEKKGPGVIKTIFLILIFLGVGFVVMNQMGVDMLETSENVVIDNRPGTPAQTFEEFKERKDKRKKDRDERTVIANNRLQSFVQDYRRTGDRDLKQAEIKFLQKMDEKVQKESSTIETAKEYYNFMQKSVKFYKTMKQFTGMTQKNPTPVSYPKNDIEADRLINRIFSVEQEKLEIFTEGDPDPDEWVDFLED